MKVRLAGRLTSVVAATMVGLSALTIAPAAHAAPVPEIDRLVLYDVFVQETITRGSIGGVNFSLHPYGGTPTTVMTDTQGIEMHVVLSSCGKVVTERTSVMRGFDAFIYTGFGADQRYYSPNPSEISDRIGPSIEYTLTVTEPGYDPYTFTGSTSAYTSRPSCQDLSGDNGKTIPVRAWSAKYAQLDPTVGSLLTISDTRADGARIAYAWTVAEGTGKLAKRTAKVVSRGVRTFKVKPAYRGKSLSVTVTVTKGTGKNAKVLTKTLNYGKVS
jgi:hypothetical protein